MQTRLLTSLAADHLSSRPRILLAWEHGRNLGHISRLLAIAKLTEAHGGELVWAVPAAYLNTPELVDLPHARFVAPAMGQASTPKLQRIDSFADILFSFGFGDAVVLGSAIRAWIQLFETVQPHSVVLDYAPAAQLAAYLLGVRAFQVTNGFDAPPVHCPVFGIALRGPYVDRLNEQKLSCIQTIIERVGRGCAGIAGTTLEAYFKHPTKVYDCIPETDPYGPRDDGMCVGPLAVRPSEYLNTDAASWPTETKRRNGDPHLFAYLRNVPDAKGWLDALCAAPAQILCVWPDIPADLLLRHDCSHVRIARQPVSMQHSLEQADAVLNYGSTTTVCQTLLAGKPQLMLPIDSEKMLVAQKVVQHGAGLVWRKGRGSCNDALRQLLHTSSLAAAAQAVAIKYSTEQMRHRQNLFAQALVNQSRQGKEEDAR